MKKIKELNSSKIIMILSVIGILISIYLSYSKLTDNVLICGFGDCNKVQRSPYATVLGIPISFLGVVYYYVLFILASKKKTSYQNIWILWGVMFSSYLTYLELFVINAICMWCVFSFADILLIAGVAFVPGLRKYLARIIK